MNTINQEIERLKKGEAYVMIESILKDRDDHKYVDPKMLELAIGSFLDCTAVLKERLKKEDVSDDIQAEIYNLDFNAKFALCSY